ncbi:tyrosinase [Byssothecium circinans]|uniref:tyrosinase n=1 Tax=Byssothecium circinans TaxID=147558 RepID=A0A6A5U3L8_9PLEO|nr:tyrosinase [Byssothecium circinans]
MRLTGLPITLTLATCALCTPTGLGVPWADVSEGRHLTTGIMTRASGGHPYIRREIRDLKDHHPETWSLFLLGFRAFQQMDQNDPLSYYQITGIHGRPWRPWQNANGVDNPGGNSYCPHNNMMFVPWHRPYVALFEQELHKHVRRVAEQATTDQWRWIMVADAFRLPYWDWALGLHGGEFPEFFTTPTITVDGPQGQQTILNPLYQYDFHPVSEKDFDGDWAHINMTVRCPTSHNPDMQSQNQLIVQAIFDQRRNWHDNLANYFSTSVDFNDFVTNLQGLHGNLHNVIGGSTPGVGHMLLFDYSAFDPVFMFVHANVDRLATLYQAVHPESWMAPASSMDSGNFWIPNHVTLDADMQMQPFWRDKSSFYTPNEIRETSVFGYVYPETQRWNYASEQEWRTAVNASIALQYSTSARSVLTSGCQTSGQSLTHLLKDDTFTEWTTKVKASSLDMPPRFHVTFSLVGTFSSDKSTEVGIWVQQMITKYEKNAWKARQMEQKAKRYNSLEKNLEGTISLTASLLDQISGGNLKSLEAVDVVPYLKAHLTWKTFADADVIVQHQEYDSLDVEVVSTQVRIPDDPKQPLEYNSETTSHPEITQRNA